MTNGAMPLPTRYGLASAPSVIQRPSTALSSGPTASRGRRDDNSFAVERPQAGVWWCGVFQVVKTAQSRERAERTLLTL
jgi:hypothetical protein